MQKQLLPLGRWFSLAVLVFVACWTGYYHCFGSGFFRPIVYVEPKIVQLGTVSCDTECEFIITNKGYRPLSVFKVYPGCSGCLEAVDYPKEPLRRNQSGIIRIKLLTESLQGTIRKSIVIRTNDPSNQAVGLLVDAVIEKGQITEKPE